MSVDGFIAGPGETMDWIFDYWGAKKTGRPQTSSPTTEKAPLGFESTASTARPGWGRGLARRANERLRR